jgi:hypothetical protein
VPETFRVKVSQLTPSTHVPSPSDTPPGAVPTQETEAPRVGPNVAEAGSAACVANGSTMAAPIAIAIITKAIRGFKAEHDRGPFTVFELSFRVILLSSYLREKSS